MSKNGNAGEKAGYGRPPRHTRFKPGQSGNPKGRPRRKTNVVEIFDRSLHQYVTVRIDGRQRRVSLAEALIHQILTDAAKGDHRARAMFLKLEGTRAATAAEAEERAQDTETDTPESPADKAILEQLERDIRDQVMREMSVSTQPSSRPSTATKSTPLPVRSRPRPTKEY